MPQCDARLLPREGAAQAYQHSYHLETSEVLTPSQPQQQSFQLQDSWQQWAPAPPTYRPPPYQVGPCHVRESPQIPVLAEAGLGPGAAVHPARHLFPTGFWGANDLYREVRDVESWGGAEWDSRPYPTCTAHGPLTHVPLSPSHSQHGSPFQEQYAKQKWNESEAKVRLDFSCGDCQQDQLSQCGRSHIVS